MITQQEELRRIINLIESAQQPAQAEDGARIAASVAPYVKELDNMDFDISDLQGLKEEELDEINWKKGLAGVAAAGALALGGAGAAHASELSCIVTFKIASATAAKSGNMQAAQAFNQAAFRTGKMLNPMATAADINDMARDFMQPGVMRIQQLGGLGPAVQSCITALNGR